mmetsp:Transcript_12118/g.38928  ORF Transcript_12118/g.38928 Transcript_12118/m.38928 type:complete len:308 (+) Transcript_12118:198-1121(+)
MQRKTAEYSSRMQRSTRPLERWWGDRSARSASRLLLLLSVVEGCPTAHVPLSARALVDDRRGDALLGQHAQKGRGRRHAHLQICAVEIVSRLDFAPEIGLVLLGDTRSDAHLARAQPPAAECEGQDKRLARPSHRIERRQRPIVGRAEDPRGSRSGSGRLLDDEARGGVQLDALGIREPGYQRVVRRRLLGRKLGLVLRVRPERHDVCVHRPQHRRRHLWPDRWHLVDGRRGELHQRHRVRLEELALRLPLHRHRPRHRLGRQLERRLCGRLQRTAVERDGPARGVRDALHAHRLVPYLDPALHREV